MRILLAILSAGTLFFSPLQLQPVYAADCSAGARKLVKGKPEQTILSVRSEQVSGGKPVCIARIKIASKDGTPPRVVERRFKP